MCTLWAVTFTVCLHSMIHAHTKLWSWKSKAVKHTSKFWSLTQRWLTHSIMNSSLHSVDSKKNLTYNHAHTWSRKYRDVSAHAGKEEAEKRRGVSLSSPFLAAQWLQTPECEVCGRLSSFFKSASLSLTHFSTCSYRVALVALCSGVRWTKTEGKRRRDGRDSRTNESCPDWW